MLHHSSDSLGIFSRSGRISHDILVRAQCLAAEAGEPISLALTRLGLASEQEVADIFAESLGLEIVSSDDLCRLEPKPHDLSMDFLKRFHVLPIHGGDEGSIAVAMADPSDRYAMEAIELATSQRVRPFVALATDLEAALDRLSLRGTSHAEAGEADRAQAFEGSRLTELERLREAASDAPVIRLVNQLLGRAVDERASDLHLEPTMDGLTVRLRVDGRLQALPPLSAHLRDPVVSRIKLLANLDIAERRLPQDGRLNFGPRNGSRFPRCDLADPARRERGRARAGPRASQAVAHRPRLRRGRARPVANAACLAERHDPRDRPDRKRKDDDALRCP